MKLDIVCFVLISIWQVTSIRQNSIEKENEVDEDQVLVKTLNGVVRGVRKTILGENVDVFLGVPFAKPPVGDLRFKKSLPVDSWPNIYDANSLPNSCPQTTENWFKWSAKEPFSEDCLYLNLWVPTKLNPARSVLIFIHGGSYRIGSSAMDLYDGQILASQNDIIVASFNYRLGVLGFLYLGNEDAPGNMALHDQFLAIQWIKDNIRSFGGDPNSLTIMGQSAGAASVTAHLLSPISKHLFRRAIVQSGSVNAGWSFSTTERNTKKTVSLINDVGCGSSLSNNDTASAMKCLRTVDVHKLLNAQETEHFSPTNDGVFLPSHPNVLINESWFSDVEILLGIVQDEGTIQLIHLDEENSSQSYSLKTMVNYRYADAETSQLEREAIVFQYTDWESDRDYYYYRKIFADVIGDEDIVCPLCYFAQKFTERNGTAYFYQFAHRSSNNPRGKWMGVPHGEEIDYVFGKPLLASLNFTMSERELSQRIMKYFTTFAKTGKPAANETDWPIYSQKDMSYFILDEGAGGIGHGPRKKACAFWNLFLPTIRTQKYQCT